VTRLLQDTISPHMHGVHCVSHRTNLAIKELSHLPVIDKIENLLHNLHKYFARSPKRHIEFTRLSEVMQTKGLKIIRNNKTRWLSMLSPLKRVMSEYRTLVHKMHQDGLDGTSTSAAREVAIGNYNLLVDISIPIALAGFLPLLETVHYLVKFSQQQDIFICDYLAAVKVCQGQLYELYCDPVSSFTSDSFREFTDLISGRHDSMSLSWVPGVLDVNEAACEYVVFKCGPFTHSATMPNGDGGTQTVSREAFKDIVDNVKGSCIGMAMFLQL
jgi:hypothetical protein